MKEAMPCPDPMLLESYLDGEASAMDARRLAAHLAQCSDCRRSMRLMNAMKVRLAGLQTPEMPRDLAAALEGMVPEPIRLSPAAAAVSLRSCAWGLCAALAVACVFWLRTSSRDTVEIPVEWLLAQHRRDAAGLPLAAAERAVPEESWELSHDF